MTTNSKDINWTSAIFLTTYQVILLITLPFYFYYGTLHTGTIISAIVLLWLTGLSITAGYHRYFAHKTYKAHPIVEFFLVFFGTMSCQASVLRWSFEHRLHHAFVDTDKDPYNIQKGFWYAHCLWILDKPQELDPKVISDLMSNRLLVFQHRYYKYLMLLTNAMAFLLVGFIFQDYWGAFFLALWTRMFALQHFTWFINSLAHTWGSKQFSQEQSAVDNYVIALLTFGEGYHNYHHTFANDYRNGVRWFHFDPTKWLIWSLSKVGLVHSLKQVDPLTIKKRMVIEHKNFLLESIGNYWNDKKQELEKQVVELSERILNTISEFSQLKQLHQETQKNQNEMTSMEQVQKQIAELQKNLKQDWIEWKNLSRNILKSSTRPTA